VEFTAKGNAPADPEFVFAEHRREVWVRAEAPYMLPDSPVELNLQAVSVSEKSAGVVIRNTDTGRVDAGTIRVGEYASFSPTVGKRGLRLVAVAPGKAQFEIRWGGAHGGSE
jgi:hypothetical protein